MKLLTYEKQTTTITQMTIFESHIHTMSHLNNGSNVKRKKIGNNEINNAIKNL
jgi:hypothetical protein